MKIKIINLCIASWLMVALIVIVSICGLVVPRMYANELFAWRQQATGQDLLDLCLICPALLLSTIGVCRKSNAGLAWWIGINIYLAYTFAIYCFTIHFNVLFLLYCAVLGLSFYSAIQGVALAVYQFTFNARNDKWARITCWYFIITSTLFCSLWLLDILSALLKHTLPVTLLATGLPANPVEVLDLSIVLPGICIAAIMALRNNIIAKALQPVILVFMILMQVTIAFLNFYLTVADNVVGICMLLLTGISFYFLHRTKGNAVLHQ